MKKRILSLGVVVILIVMLVILTGCGKKTVEYTENMKKMREYSAGYIDNKSIGEILDVAVVDADWQETAKEGATKSGKIIVKGKDKKTNVDIEITWLTTKGMYEDNGFDSFTKNGEKLTYGDLLDYLKDYVPEIDSND